MSEIFGIIQTYTDYLGIIIFAFLAIGIITILVDILIPKIPFAKYVPGVLALLVGLILFVTNLPQIYVKDNIPIITYGGILIGCGIVSLCIALIIGMIRGKNKKSKTYIEYEEY